MQTRNYLSGKIGLLLLLTLLTGCANVPYESAKKTSPDYTAAFDECVASALEDLGDLSDQEKQCVGHALIDWSVMSDN